MIEIISLVISAITLLILVINQYRMIKDKEPQLLFNLRSMNNKLYLMVKNSGMTKAKNIKISIKKIYNNRINSIEEDQIFQIPFELSSQEEIQGMIGYFGETEDDHVFPYIDIIVNYQKTHFIKKVSYERQVFYYAAAEEKISVNTNLDEIINNISETLSKLVL